MELSVGDSLNGFEVQRKEVLPEIDGTAYILRHTDSGARLLYLANDDNNKAFSISFKTPPKNDTGVFHILEHSVLCGSKKFPVKEPFVNLLKSSMQTFLNAMTFPDKTMYPVASTNEQDLLNLTDVYMDAVLHPAIYTKPTIFEQEGWHYELATDDENPNETPQLFINGVVYNEMKGVMSDPNSVLFDGIQSALFPDTAYVWESGGTPEAIPDLTYEAFIDQHERHYALSNSYIIVYGDLDIAAMLAFLDDNYLREGAAAEKARDEKRAAAGLEPLTPNPLALQSAVVSPDVKISMDTAAENACIALGYVIGESHEKTRVVATDLLFDAIMGSNEAPLKRALLDAGLASDAHGGVVDGVAQPFALIELRGLNEGKAGEFEPLVRKVLQELADGGLDHELLRASLSHAEFVMREHNFGMADGVALAMTAMSGWLYDDAEATTYLRYEDDYAFLRNAIDEGYFEDLIKEVLLQSKHWAQVEVVPTETDITPEAMRIAAIQATLSPADYEAIEAKVCTLREAQEAPDSPADIAKLPHLSLADLNEAGVEPAYGLRNDTPIPCLYHSVPTRGIAYATWCFNGKVLTFDEVPYAAILTSVLGKLDTAHHTAAELDTLTNGLLGDMSFFSAIDARADGYLFQILASTSALEENVEKAFELTQEVLLTTDFSNTDRILDILEQKRIGLEQAFATSGNTYAAARVATHYMDTALIADAMNGVDFYLFLKELLNHYDERKEALVEKLQELSQRLFFDENCMADFGGSEEALKIYWSHGTPTGRSGDTTQRLTTPALRSENEAFIVPTDICYVSTGNKAGSDEASFNGSWLVATRMLTYDYLWNSVRVQGGAYGVGFQTSHLSTMRFYSYRDPHLDETLAAYRQAPAWLQSFTPDEQEFEGFVVATTANFDTPLKARALIRRQRTDHFSGRSPEDRQRVRHEIVNTTLNDVHAVAEPLANTLAKEDVCVFGSRSIIEQAATPLTVIDLLKA